MSLDKAMKNLKFDKRMAEINLNNGQLTQEELKKHLEGLQDLAAQVDMISLTDDDSDTDKH